MDKTHIKSGSMGIYDILPILYSLPTSVLLPQHIMTVLSFNILVGMVALLLLQMGVHARPSSQISKVKGLLKFEQKFCEKLLNGQTPNGVSTVFETVQTTLPLSTKVLTAKSFTTDATVTNTLTSYVLDVSVTTVTEDVTAFTYTATTTDSVTATETVFANGHGNKNHRRKNFFQHIHKSQYPKTVQKYTDSIVADACYLILYGSLPQTSITATTTATVTSASMPVTTTTTTAVIEKTELDFAVVTNTVTKSFTKSVINSSSTDTVTATGTTTATTAIATATVTVPNSQHGHGHNH
jgi:hypothetical protein